MCGIEQYDAKILNGLVAEICFEVYSQTMCICYFESACFVWVFASLWVMRQFFCPFLSSVFSFGRECYLPLSVQSSPCGIGCLSYFKPPSSQPSFLLATYIDRFSKARTHTHNQPLSHFQTCTLTIHKHMDYPAHALCLHCKLLHTLTHTYRHTHTHTCSGSGSKHSTS